MKAVMLMFDTLRYDKLSAYCDTVKTPNFERLAKNTVKFNNFYAGSLPCMPARRELHTGRYNFLHRSWGPLEPFDDSMIEMLNKKQIYTHLITDHSHYFEDGGATYHNRYQSCEFFRGQEGDRHLARIKDVEIPNRLETSKKTPSIKQFYTNNPLGISEEDYPSVKTITSGINFIKKHSNEDNWFLQIECFDPHEPFQAPERFRKMFTNKQEKLFNWPAYKPANESSDEINDLNNEYLALLLMCDEYLGKVLDQFDENNLWEDTMLIVNTDHGLLLGEHGYLGKNVMPLYDEIAKLPFFIYDPRLKIKNLERNALAQTIDIAPTILNYFGIDKTPIMQGHNITSIIKNDEAVRDYALFGVFGNHVCIKSDDKIYMRATQDLENDYSYQHTLMPTNMRGFFNVAQLQNAETINLGEITKDIPVLKVKQKANISSYFFGDQYFDTNTDVSQKNNLYGTSSIEILTKLKNALIESAAPVEQLIRLGLNEDLTDEFLYNQYLTYKQDQIFITDIKLDNKTNNLLNFVKLFLDNEAKSSLKDIVKKDYEENKLNKDNYIDFLYENISSLKNKNMIRNFARSL